MVVGQVIQIIGVLLTRPVWAGSLAKLSSGVTVGPDAVTPAPLTIWVAEAVAEASTELAAFDACLLRSGIGNLNLLYLSSVIPPGACIKLGPAILDSAE